MKLKTILLSLLLIFAFVACSPAGGEPPFSDNPATETPDPNAPVSSDDPTIVPATEAPVDLENIIIDQAQVETIEILILESFPVQIQVHATGYLGDGCTTLGDITTRQESNMFFVTIATQRPAEAICTQIAAVFEENFALDVYGLPAGTYTVDVNGVTNSFTLDIDNVPQLPDTENDPPSGVELPQEDMAELIRLTLERALVAQEVPDYSLLTYERDEIVLSTENIDPALVPELTGVNLVVLTPEEIQAKANAEGDFLYLTFREITAVSPTEARVSLDNIWMPAEDSEMLYLSGGGFVIEFSKTAAGWQGEVTEMWIS